MSYSKVEDKIRNKSTKGISYTVGKISWKIKLPLLLLTALLVAKTNIGISIIVGLYVAEFIMYNIIGDKPLSLLEVVEPILQDSNLVEHDTNIVLSDSDIDTSIIIGETDMDDHDAIIFVSKPKRIYGLRLLAELKTVYSLSACCIIASAIINERSSYDNISENLLFIKIGAVIYTITDAVDLLFKG